MMKRIFLCLLCLSGWSVSSCLTRQYHYVDDPMTWTEAQTYCRQKYTDLATVENTEETDQLKSSVPSLGPYDGLSGNVWIGLYSNIQWKWSDGYTGEGSGYRNWERVRVFKPSFQTHDSLCVMKDKGGTWLDGPCSSKLPSICYNGTQQDPDFVYVGDKMSWSDAQRYCRKNYVDLATVRNDEEDRRIQRLKPYKVRPWIGLYRDPDVFWSDESGYSFRFWFGKGHQMGSLPVVCGAASLPDSGKWRLHFCNHKFPFVCYSTATGSKHVIKLKMKQDNPSVDLNDPAVKAGLLRQLQDQLKESGLSGVTLKWREQADGKVFHKEEESSQEKDEEKCEM